LTAEQISQLLLSRLGLRVEPEMGKYLAGVLVNSREPLALIAGDARTGMALRRVIAPVDILDSSTQQGAA
jgi:hypothetical protein